MCTRHDNKTVLIFFQSQYQLYRMLQWHLWRIYFSPTAGRKQRQNEIVTVSSDIYFIRSIMKSLYRTILDKVLLYLVTNDETKFYHIRCGNSSYTDALERRYWIPIWTRVTKIQLGNRSTTLTYGWSSSISSQRTSKIFYAAIIATTASLFDRQANQYFIDKYNALWKLHHKVISKLGFHFTKKWWCNLDIDDGSSTTDLPTCTAVLLASFAWSQDSLVWSSITEGKEPLRWF
jgi:hypothetical protein